MSLLVHWMNRQIIILAKRKSFISQSVSKCTQECLPFFSGTSEFNGNECFENENLVEPNAMPFFQPQLGAIQSSQKSGKCFGSKTGAQSTPLVLSNNINNNSQTVSINGLNVLQPEVSSRDGFHWHSPSYSSVDWKNDSIDKFLAPIGSNLVLANPTVAVPSIERTVFTNAITVDAKQNCERYYENALPKSLKESLNSKRSAPLRNLMTALSPIQSMSCSTASARIDSPLLLTASPSEELSPLSWKKSKTWYIRESELWNVTLETKFLMVKIILRVLLDYYFFCSCRIYHICRRCLTVLLNFSN